MNNNSFTNNFIHKRRIKCKHQIFHSQCFIEMYVLNCLSKFPICYFNMNGLEKMQDGSKETIATCLFKGIFDQSIFNMPCPNHVLVFKRLVHEKRCLNILNN